MCAEGADPTEQQLGLRKLCADLRYAGGQRTAQIQAVDPTVEQLGYRPGAPRRGTLGASVPHKRGGGADTSVEQLGSPSCAVRYARGQRTNMCAEGADPTVEQLGLR